MSSGSAPTRVPTWLSTSRGPIAACLHVPANGKVLGGPVVICPPLGYEATHAHRSLLRLAERLASAGFLAIRFDYLGTGDASGDARTPDLCGAWLDSIRTCIHTGLRLMPGCRVTLVGLRLGALLAGTIVAREEVGDFVAWFPVLAGRRYVRELSALESLASSGPDGQAAAIEAAGFVLAPETADALRELDLLVTPPRIRGRALVVDREDLSRDGRLVDHLRASGVTTDHVHVGGYLGMFAEPQYTEIPLEAIAKIVEWLAEGDSTTPTTLDHAALQAMAERHATEWLEGASCRLRETHVAIPGSPGASPLRGVLTEPAEGPVVAAAVLSNAGSVYRVGPNRLYVETARLLASRGVAALRADLRNLGESVTVPDAYENHPYPPTAVEDVGAMTDWMRSRFPGRPLWLTGLCSGAHSVFHAGLDDGRAEVSGIVCINPLTFDWRSGMSLDTPATHRTSGDAAYYAHSVRDPRKWIKLLRGQANLGYIIRFVFRRARDVMRAKVSALAGALRLRRPNALEERLLAYQAAGRRIRFVFSATDPGLGVLRSEAESVMPRLMRCGTLALTVVPNADHTFSRELWRAAACAAVTAFVTEDGSATETVAPVPAPELIEEGGR